MKPYECRPTPSMFTPNHEKLVITFPKSAITINPRCLIKPPHLAWRMIASPGAPGGDPIVVHELARTLPVVPAPGGYSEGSMSANPDDCGGGSIVTSVLSRGTSGTGRIALPTHAVLPVDVAAGALTFAVVAAGNGHTKELPQVFVVANDATGCSSSHFDVKGQATAIAVRSARAAMLNLPTRSSTRTRGPGWRVRHVTARAATTVTSGRSWAAERGERLR